MERFVVTYHIALEEGASARSLAESVLTEQTVEVPPAVAARYAEVRERMTGRLRAFRPAPEGGFLATLSLPTENAASGVVPFLNVLFGNASLHEELTLADFTLPPDLQALFDGPRFGKEGLRERTNVPRRPLTCSALKPVGRPVEALADLCRQLATGGIDVIKDDHYLADQPFAPFIERVQACQAAVEEVEARTGHRALYAPHLSGTPDEVRRQADRAQAAGVGAVLVAPMLLGLPLFYELVHTRLEVPVLAHPSFAGSQRIRPALLGRLFRLFGADAVIFPSYGGRFSYDRDTCAAFADALRTPWHRYRPALPTPAGGMTVERVPELVTFYGPEVMLLIGGSLLEAENAIVARARAFARSATRAGHAGNS